jgi:uncharacterized membrane protein AbrB (regulator of aidB expression)
MVRISFSINPRPIFLGATAGAIFAVVEFVTQVSLPDMVLIAAYCAILILISAPFLHGIGDGVICGIVAIVVQTVLEVVYYGSTSAFGLGPATDIFISSLLSYQYPGSPIFLYRPIYVVAGAIAGYINPKL